MSKATEFDSPLKRAARGEIGARRADTAPTMPSERQDVLASGHQDVLTLERQDATPRAGAGGAQPATGLKRQTVYLPMELATWLKIHSATTGEDMSGIITRLVERYRADQG